VRSRYRAATLEPGYSELIEQAILAANRAIELAPDAYLTHVATMQIALSQGNYTQFLTIHDRLRTDHPGDLYLHLRIASRLARLGMGQEAIAIYEEADRLGASLAGRSAELALAHFVAGAHEEAANHMTRTNSTQQYVLVLGAAIFEHLHQVERAQDYVAQLLDANPDIAEEF